MTGATPWLVLVGLGLFHGLNPAMGWLFAVALGLHRQNRKIVVLSLLPIAAGHAIAVITVVIALIALGTIIDLRWLGKISGVILIAWAAYHAVYGHRHRVRFGMQTGMLGLALWSFLMAGAHGAGLMLIPVLLPLCGASAAGEIASRDSMLLSLAAVGVHTAAMLLITGIIAVIVYEWFGLAFLKRGWINLDWVWTGALVVTGAILLI